LLAITSSPTSLIRTLAWRIVLAPKGLISNTLLDWGLINHRLNLLDSRTGVQIGVVYNYLPLMIFPLFVALDRLDPALREGSKDLFADRLATFREVTLPLARPGIVAGIILVFVRWRRLHHGQPARRRQGQHAGQPRRLAVHPGTEPAARRRRGGDSRGRNPGVLGLGFLAGWAIGRLNRIDRRLGSIVTRSCCSPLERSRSAAAEGSGDRVGAAS
jgi:hypothetical protein